MLFSSRDAKAVLWRLNQDKVGAGDLVDSLNCVEVVDNSVLELDSSINSCDILNRFVNDDLLVGFGLEDGRVLIYNWSKGSSSWSKLFDKKAHHLPVRKVRWCPRSGQMLLASCSDDKSVQIYELLV